MIGYYLLVLFAVEYLGVGIYFMFTNNLWLGVSYVSYSIANFALANLVK